MPIEIGLIQDELTNTQFAPIAVLSAYYHQQKVFEPLEDVQVAMKSVDFTPVEKLQQLFLSILSGCKYVSEVNIRLRPETGLAQVNRIERFAHQSTLADTLDSLTQMNIEQLGAAVAQISHRCGRTPKHDWRGFLVLDFDLSGLPCGQGAEGSTKGFFSGKKTRQDANWPV